MKNHPNIAALNSRHLCFCESDVAQLGVSRNPGSLTGFSQDTDQDVIRASSQGSAGGGSTLKLAHGVTKTQLLTGCWVGWSLSSCWLLAKGLPHFLPTGLRHRAAQHLTSPTPERPGHRAEPQSLSVTNPRSDIHHFPELCLLEMSLWVLPTLQGRESQRWEHQAGGSLGPILEAACWRHVPVWWRANFTQKEF